MDGLRRPDRLRKGSGDRGEVSTRGSVRSHDRDPGGSFSSGGGSRMTDLETVVFDDSKKRGSETNPRLTPGKVSNLYHPS